MKPFWRGMRETAPESRMESAARHDRHIDEPDENEDDEDKRRCQQVRKAYAFLSVRYPQEDQGRHAEGGEDDDAWSERVQAFPAFGGFENRCRDDGENEPEDEQEHGDQ